jgi:hypothetical protein
METTEQKLQRLLLRYASLPWDESSKQLHKLTQTLHILTLLQPEEVQLQVCRVLEDT